jgi:hypothetical protein
VGVRVLGATNATLQERALRHWEAETRRDRPFVSVTVDRIIGLSVGPEARACSTGGRGPRTCGIEEQMTHEGGSFPFESVDGGTLYYKKGALSEGDAPLMSRPRAGGEESMVLACVKLFGYAVAPRGIFYHGCDTQGSPQRTLRYWDAVSKEERQVGTVTADVIAGLMSRRKARVSSTEAAC